MNHLIKSDTGVYVHENTNSMVSHILECLRQDRNEKGIRTRVKISYGNTETGVVDWVEYGRVSCSMGPMKIFILLHNKRSLGGGGISTQSILKIESSNKKNYELFYNGCNQH